VAYACGARCKDTIGSLNECGPLIQWRLPGPDRFLAAYADGLERFGYENSNLEKMAYEGEALWRLLATRFDPEKYVAQRLTA
jgi:hypothetical protein